MSNKKVTLILVHQLSTFFVVNLTFFDDIFPSCAGQFSHQQAGIFKMRKYLEQNFRQKAVDVRTLVLFHGTDHLKNHIYS